jgi:hypothetical protein
MATPAPMAIPIAMLARVTPSDTPNATPMISPKGLNAELLLDWLPKPHLDGRGKPSFLQDVLVTAFKKRSHGVQLEAGYFLRTIAESI